MRACTHESKHFLERSLFAFCPGCDCMLFCQHFQVVLYACMRMCVCVRVGACVGVCVCGVWWWLCMLSYEIV